MSTRRTRAATRNTIAATRSRETADALAEKAWVNVSTTTIPNDTDATPLWEVKAASRMEVSTLTKSAAGADWISVSDDGSIDSVVLEPGDYKVTMELCLQNTHASLSANVKYGIVDEDDNVFYTSGNSTARAAAVQNACICPVTSLEVSLTATKRVYPVMALGSASQTCANVPGISRVRFERVA